VDIVSPGEEGGGEEKKISVADKLRFLKKILILCVSIV
jgi:ABC-type iron transport system FetAB ATPase subunit